MDRRAERREGGLSGQQTSRYEHLNKLAGHPGGWAVKPVDAGKRITTVDGITRKGLCLLSGRILSRKVWSGDSVWRVGPWIRSGECRSTEVVSCS